MSALTTAAKLRPGGPGKGGSGSGAAARPRQPPVRPRGSLIAGIDIGSTKICCFIAQVDGTDADPRDRPPGLARYQGRDDRQPRRGSRPIRTAVHAAEEMAGATIDQAVVSLSAGFGASRMVKAEIAVGGREIGDSDLRHVLERGYAMRDTGDRQVIHILDKLAAKQQTERATGVRPRRGHNPRLPGRCRRQLRTRR